MRFHPLLLAFAALSVSASPIEPRQNCADVTVFFARGTDESGTLGTIVGPPFQVALQSALSGRSLSFVGVPYPATVAGFFAVATGAQVTHLAAENMSSSTRSRVSGAIVFGDPDNGQAFAGGIVAKTFCAPGDDICDGGAIILPSHLSYGANAGEAAAFVVSRL